MSDKLAKVEEGTGIARGFMPQSFNDVARISKALSEARGFVPRDMLGNPNAIAAAIMTGLEIGIGPMQALRSIYVIDGRPMISADLMLSLAIRAGVRPQWLESTGEIARLRLTRSGFEPHEHTFTIAEAKQAGLAGRGNWSKYPAAMLRARCLSAAMRAFCPDVIGSGVYVEGEIEHVAAVEEPERESPRREAAIEAQLAEAEANCGAAPPHIERDERSEQPARTKLTDCADELQLREWLRRYGPAVQRSGRLASVVQHADRIGIGDATAWVDAVLAELTEAA